MNNDNPESITRAILNLRMRKLQNMIKPTVLRLTKEQHDQLQQEIGWHFYKEISNQDMDMYLGMRIEIFEPDSKKIISIIESQIIA